MKIILNTVIALLSLGLSAQIVGNATNQSFEDGLFLNQTNVKGTPFFVKDWSKGSFQYDNGQHSEEKQLVYNLYNNTLFVKTGPEKTDAMALDISNIKGFTLYEENTLVHFVKVKGSQFGKTKDVTKFYQLAKPGSELVIIEHIKEFEDPNNSGWSSSTLNNKGGEFKSKTDVYVLGKDGYYQETKAKKGAILSTFSDQKDALSQYIKDNKLKIGDPVDLVPIVEYYNSL